MAYNDFMDTTTNNLIDPVAILRQLNAETIRQRIDEIDRERDALMVLIGKSYLPLWNVKFGRLTAWVVAKVNADMKDFPHYRKVDKKWVTRHRKELGWKGTLLQMKVAGLRS